MKPELILEADIIDIIFEGRNKDYGAYQLRKSYNKRLLVSMLPVIGILVVLFVFQMIRPSSALITLMDNKVTDTVKLIKIPPVEPPSLPAPKPPPPDNPATIDFATPVISATESDTIPTIDELDQNVLISDKTNPGVEAIGPPPLQPEPSQGEAAPQPVAEPVPEVLNIAERMPEYPGGKAALYRFLNKNLRVPEEHMEPGQRIRQLVRFVVQQDGTITGLSFVESGGSVFEQEVIRVVKKMPKWIPGHQNGRDVSVFFTIPIIFEVPE